MNKELKTTEQAKAKSRPDEHVLSDGLNELVLCPSGQYVRITHACWTTLILLTAVMLLVFFTGFPIKAVYDQASSTSPRGLLVICLDQP